jgi:hypothetical protein
MKRKARESEIATAIRKAYDLPARDGLGQFASGDGPALAQEEEPRSLWRHHGSVVKALRGRRY